MSGGTIVIMMGIDGTNPYSWCIPVVAWAGFIILAAATKYVSLGSCWAGFSFPVSSWFVYRDPLLLLLAIVVGGLILWKHRGNMVRIVKGTESKFTLHKKKPVDTVPEKAGETPASSAAGTAEEAEAAVETAPEEVSVQAEQEDKT